MSMNPNGEETHMTLADAEAVFGVDFPPMPAPTLVIVQSDLGVFVFEVHGVDFPDEGPIDWNMPTPF